MKKIILLVVVLLILAVGYFFFTSSIETRENGLASAEGIVTEIYLDNVAFDGPILIAVEAEEGDVYTIAVPSMGLPLCAALENIADPFALSVGDMVSVAGQPDEVGRIVPCAAEDHYLRAVSTVLDETLGYQFTYPKGPDGYILLDDTESQDPDFVSGLVLFNKNEYEVFQNSTDAREGPPSMHVRVYENPQKLSAFVWPERKPLESNIGLAFGEAEEAVVGGANASHYLVDGLYPIDTYVVAHGQHIYILMGAYFDEETPLYKDFQSLVSSFTFVQTEDQI